MASKDYTDDERHQIEHGLNVEILPGTEIMADVSSHYFVKGSHRNSIWWKTACIISTATVTFTQGFGPLALAPMFPALMEAFQCDLTEAIQFTGLCILMLGFSNFIWVPISTSFGRRPVYLLSQLVNFGASIWRARANSYGSFMGTCIVNGIGAGPSETIMPEVIADIFFLHDRGKWNTLYWVVYMGSLMAGPIVSGSMTESIGFRSFWWLNAGLIGASFLMLVFMFPETRFKREESDFVPTKHIYDAEKSQAVAGENSSSSDDGEIHHVNTATSTIPANKNLTLTETAALDPYLGTGTPGRWQWRTFQPNAHPFRSIFLDL
ncbi:transmembrane transport [Ascochyta rabiei]|uniref:Transmembrane transport n=1 Tax=Didymella rabiei TaxID=5454 RepID=A0A163M8P6_DIDRA|nr:transmembrane transport [Ascochyta rabiei]